MSPRTPPIPAEWADRSEGRTLLRAFERLCGLETSVTLLDLEISELQADIVAEAAKAAPSGVLVQVNTDLVQRGPGFATGLPSLTGVSGGKGGGGTGGGGSTPPAILPPDVVKHPGNKLSHVNAAHAKFPVSTACAPPEGNGSFAFLNELVRTLRTESIRWGFGCVRSNCGETRTDQVLYYAGLDTGNPPSPNDLFYNFDVIGSVCGANPTPQWTDKSLPGQGTSTRWKYPR